MLRLKHKISAQSTGRCESRVMSRAERAVAQRPGALVAWTVAVALVALCDSQFILQAAFALGAVSANAPPSSVPLPPARPPVPATGAATTDIPSTGSTPAAPGHTPASAQDRQPRSLPQASRARMHACGLEWQKMKQSGATPDRTWFDFARICLTK
jgi:hypothetical protein